jgi:hypothetical protein
MNTVLIQGETVYIDSGPNEHWLRRQTRQKAGFFYTNDEGRVIFAGGPGAGAGGASSVMPSDMDADTGLFYATDFILRNEVPDMPGYTLEDRLEGLEYISDTARGRVKAEIVADLAARSGIDEATVNDFIATWADTANDNNPDAMLIQQTAAELFNAPLTPWQQDTADSLERARVAFTTPGTIQYELHNMFPRDRIPGEPTFTKEQTQRLLQAMYENTQAQLQQHVNGATDTLTLFRGFTSDDEYALDRWANLRQNSLSSWTVSPAVANKFAVNPSGGTYGYIVRITVPLSRVVGSCRTGFGCLTEGEFVLAGGPQPDTVFVTGGEHDYSGWDY